MAEEIVSSGQADNSGSGSIIYWVLGVAVLGGAGFAAWYYLIRKKDDASSSSSTDEKPKGNDIDIQEPTDNAKTTSSFEERKKEEPIGIASATVESIKSSSGGLSLDGMVKVADGVKVKGKSDFSAGQSVKANGKQSIQRMKKNKSGQISDKDDNGKLWGYSKVSDGDSIGAVEVRYDGGMVVKAPAKYKFPYYYVKYSQVK